MKTSQSQQRAAGIDGMSIDDFHAWAKEGGWKLILTELRSGQYQPSSVRRLEIDKPGGGIRQLGILSDVDMVIWQATA